MPAVAERTSIRKITHQPVLLDEVVAVLDPAPGSVVVDATVGLGGHAEALLERMDGRGRLVGIDRDPRALELAAERLARCGAAFVPIRGDHRMLRAVLDHAAIERPDAILFDLGVSSLQLDDPERGFSFRADGPLDMRMDPEQGETAADLVARLSERELARLIHEYGEERRARAVARAIVRRRSSEPIVRTRQLAELVQSVVRTPDSGRRIHPATRTFQALRIAVNREIEGLDELVAVAVDRLAPRGRVAFLSYHSLEDRQVKHTLRELARSCICPSDLPVCACGGGRERVRVLTPRSVRPSDAECEQNPRARSARLRAAERT
jgi:16S rRNA (cytosine1402-N4)-methyltransferase